MGRFSYSHVPLILNLTIISSVICVAALELPSEDAPLAMETIQLLSAFDQCISYIFDWGNPSRILPSGSVRFLQFYSNNIRCSTVLDMYWRNYSAASLNKRYYPSVRMQPLRLFTRFTLHRLRLFVPRTMDTVTRNNHAALNDLNYLVWRFNFGPNYFLVWIKSETLRKLESAAIEYFRLLVGISIATPYILIVDERAANFLDFSQLLRRKLLLTPVFLYEEKSMRELHDSIHRNLNGVSASIVWTSEEPKLCTPLNGIRGTPDACPVGEVLGRLRASHGMPRLSAPQSLWVNPSITLIAMRAFPSSIDFCLHREKGINLDWMIYVGTYQRFKFLNVVGIESSGLNALWTAF